MDLTTTGLPKELTDKMAAAKRMCAERCITCGVGRGRWCEHRETNHRRNLSTARFQLRVAEATVAAKTEGHPGNREAARKHAERLRAYIAELEG